MPLEDSIYQPIFQAFIIPSYKEDLDLLSETLDHIASHPRATRTYMIFLAMEAHEEGSDLKAEELIRRYNKKFKYMNYTRHEMR